MKDLNRKRIVSQIDGMAEAQIRFDGIEPLILELICAQLFHESDAAPLLLLVDKYSRAFLSDGAQGHLKLVVTIAAKRMKGLARCALRMNANQWRITVEVSQDERKGGFLALVRGFPAGVKGFEGQQTEDRPPGGKFHFSDLFQDHRYQAF